MAYSVDYSEDWQFVDGIETLTLTPQSGSAKTVRGCRTTVTNPAGSVGGGYQPEPTLTVFYVWDSSGLGNYVPMIGDRITDGASVNWIVGNVTRQSDVSQWGLSCSRAT